MHWLAYALAGLAGLLVLLLATVGLLYLARGTPVRRVRAQDGGELPGADEPAFRATVELLTKTELRPGHAVEV